MLDIIIPVHNNYFYTMQCLASIFKSDFPKEKVNIIIVDNNSTDKTETFISYLVEEGEPITYLRQKENLNFVKGVNVGLKVSMSRYVMLLSNDTILNKKCISNMLKIFKKDKNIGIVGALEFFPDGKPTKTKPFIYWKPKTLLDPILKGVEDVKAQIETGRFWVDVDIVGMACCIIKREVINEIGLLDERFSPCHYEQEDYSMRIKQAGFKLAICVNALFMHYVAATTSLNMNYYQNIIKVNRIKFIKKWVK